MSQTQLQGGIEAGGTKFVCAVGNGPDHIEAECRLATTSPEETLQQTIEFFRPFVRAGQIGAIGVGTFGPIDADRASATFGFITSTPKPGWSNTDMAGTLQRALNVRIAFDSDVNAAALGEYCWGASRGVDSSLYVTVGTGIGAGYIQAGRPLHGLVNTEMGHIRIPHDHERDPFPGACPFHTDCFEGLASGPAIRQRFDEPAEVFPDDDPYWDLEADYIAAALTNYILILSPGRIILGGGVMQRSFLFPAIRRKVQESLNGYVDHRSLLEGIDEYIVPPALGSRAGVLGAIALAQFL
jgi:fructokinase